jgi:DNA-binding MarR family transcriptional regulator
MTENQNTEDGSELNDEVYHLMTHFRLSLFKLYGLLLKESDDTLATTNLTRSRNLLLGTLGRMNKPMTVSQLAHEMGHSRQAVSRMSSLMVKEGYLTETDNPYHRRSKLLSMTEAGRGAWQEALKRHVDLTLSNPYPVNLDDLRTTCDVLNTMTEHLESNQSAY